MVRTDRAVEILHNAGTDDEPDWSVGSGYLIGGPRVLTAAHNVGDGPCLVRFVDGSEHAAVVRQRGDEIRLDLAVVELTGEDIPDPGEPVSYAIISQGQAELISRCTGLGFPRFKEDETRPRPSSGKPLRNIEQLDGEIPTAAGALSSLLTFRVTARPREQPSPPAGAAGFGESAWQGISGTVVFARGDDFGERAVGVVSEHHLPEGGSALTLVPIGAIRSAGAVPTGEQRAWWEMLGVPDPDGLLVLPRHPAHRRSRPPPPPRGAVDRPRLMSATMSALHDRPAPLVTLVGGPGFGKSVLARLVADVVYTRGEFGDEPFCPGGVVWLDIGQEPDLPGVLAQRVTDLTGQPAGGRSVDQLANDLGEVLTQRQCLLVLDDVWSPRGSKDDVISLLAARIEGVPCLVTTRSSVLVRSEPHVRRISVEEMAPGEAVELLASALPENLPRTDIAELSDLGLRLGQWPLLLGLAAALLARQLSSGASLEESVRDLAERYAAKGVTAFDRRRPYRVDPSDPAMRNQAVAAAIEASLGYVAPGDQDRYRLLAVFPPGQPIPVDIINEFWAPDLDRFETGDLLDGLAELSLLSLDLATRQVRVHALLQEFLAQTAPQRQGTLHRRLLQSWGDPILLSDSYRIRWYAYHLDKAGDSERLYGLITPSWRDRVLAVTGALSDVAADAQRAAQHASERHHLPEELRCRLIATTLATHAQSLPRQLLTVLAQLGQADRALGYASLLPADEHAVALTDIAMAVAATDPPRASELIDQAWSAAVRLESSGKARALGRVGVALAPTEPDRALAVPEHVDDPSDQAQVLADIAAALATTDPERAIAIANGIDHPVAGPRALAAIAATLAKAGDARAKDLAERALIAADSFHPTFRGWAIKEIAVATVTVDVAHARTTANRLTDSLKVGVLAGMAAAVADTDRSLANQLADEALTAADSIDPADAFKGQTLAEVAATLARVDPGRAMAAADRISDRASVHWGSPGNTAYALAGIASALVDTDPDRATRLADLSLDGATRSSDSPDKEKSLARMATALAGDDPELALAVASDIDDPGRKATALADIAAAVADSDISRAHELAEQSLVAAAGVEDSVGRNWTFAGIARKLARTDTGLALTAAARTDHPAPRGEALAAIGTALAAAHPDQAVRVADLIDAREWISAAHIGVIASALARTNPDLAMAVAARLDEDADEGRALVGIADELVSTDLDHALAVLDRVRDPQYKALTLARVVTTVTGSDPERAGHLADQAMAVADGIDDVRDRGWAYGRIAAALAAANPGHARQLTDHALSAADHVAPGERDSALGSFVEAVAAAGGGSLAVMAINRIGHLGFKAETLAKAASLLADADPGLAGELTDMALSVADQIESWDRAVTLNDVAVTLAGTDPDRALAAADQIADPDGRAHTLGRVTAELARIDPERALQVAGQIDDPERRAEALTNLIEAQADLASATDTSGQADGDLVSQMLDRARELEPVIGYRTWWGLAQLLVVRANGLPECAVLVKGVLAATEW
jgi:hypothetical protein